MHGHGGPPLPPFHARQGTDRPAGEWDDEGKGGRGEFRGFFAMRAVPITLTMEHFAG